MLTARGRDGLLWISPLSAPPGFLEATGPAALSVRARPSPGDPLRELAAPQPVGVLAIEFATRRRVRVNGTLRAASSGGLVIDVDQAYGNCPQYIQQRTLTPAAARHRPLVRIGDRLEPQDAALIRERDTFFIGSTHPSRGSDASHRGGPAGFVRVHDGGLWWPDYAGNSMFNTLGNLAVDPEAALLFPDFSTGRTLQLSGTATVEWTAQGAPGDDDATGRRVHFVPARVAAGRLLQVHAGLAAAYPANPPLSSDQRAQS